MALTLSNVTRFYRHRQEEMKQAAEQAKKRNAWESAGGDDQDKAMELMASKVGRVGSDVG